jgi:hypothetical protein
VVVALNSFRGNVKEHCDFGYVRVPGIGAASLMGQKKRRTAVKKKKTVRTKAIRDLAARGLTAKTGKTVKGGSSRKVSAAGGDEGPEENITFVYGRFGVKYTPQN